MKNLNFGLYTMNTPRLDRSPVQKSMESEYIPSAPASPRLQWTQVIVSTAWRWRKCAQSVPAELSAESKLFALIQALLVFFASWTVAYHLVLLASLPAWMVVIPFLVLLVLFALPFMQEWKRTLLAPLDGRWFLLGLAALALASGLFGQFFYTASDDDYSYFHRAVYQLAHLDLPFATTETGHNVAGLEPLSILHIATSYEPLTALGGALLRIDPVVAYQDISGFFAAAMLPVVFALLYRLFKFDRKQALFAMVVAFVFLFLDGNVMRSFGVQSLLYLWQGKRIVWILLLPLTFLMTYRYLLNPSLQNFLAVVAIDISAVGLSNSGVYLIPAMVFGVACAFVLSYGPGRYRWLTALSINFASFYCVAIGLGLLLGVIPQPADMTAWVAGWPATWWENLALVVDSVPSLFRDLLLLLALPLFALGRPMNRLPFFLTIVFVVIFTNPLLGPIWIKLVQPASYFRFAYLFPVPWCAGLVVGVLPPRGFGSRSWLLGAGVVALSVLAVAGAYNSSVLFPYRWATYKMPFEYKFRPNQLAFVRRINPLMNNRNLLVPRNLYAVLALLNPSVKLEAARSNETIHLFSEVGQKQEGLRRVAAQDLTNTCKRTSERDAAFLRSLENGVNAVIVTNCSPDSLKAFMVLMQSAPGHWTTVERANGYVLLLREN